jgi:predicted peptidase
MKKLSPFLAALLMLAFGGGVPAVHGSTSDTGSGGPNIRHIKGATAITEVFGDGQKLTTVAIEYDKSIVSSKLSPSAFSVDGRTITKVYANEAAAKASQGIDGKFVIIELSPLDEAASILVQHLPTGPGPGGPDLSQQGPESADKGGPPFMMASPRREVKASVKQLEVVTTTDGEKYAPSASAMETDKKINLVVDDFLGLEFKDPGTGKILKYSLYVPKHYDKNKSYPMVMFIHDASACSTEPDRTLIQGNGAVIWATPSEQAKHEAFVLAPQYNGVMTTDDFHTSDMLDTTVKLINSLVSQYNIDRNRIYTTGQSMGCMLSIAMNIKYPDVFAASMLVAGQWDPQAMSVLAKKKMWIIVAEGDTRAFPGMNASLAVMKKAGAKISRAKWNGRAGDAETEANVRKMIEEGGNIKYTVYGKGTTLPVELAQSGRNEHMETWKLAYNIEGVRDWLFAQTKSPGPSLNAKQ